MSDANTEAAPFKVGQHVRVKEPHRFQRWKKQPVGVVVWVDPPGRAMNAWFVGVRREGTKCAIHGFWGERLEPIPLDDLSLDETCAQLVAAYHAGDKTAAIGLADRIVELCGGTRKGDQL